MARLRRFDAIALLTTAEFKAIGRYVKNVVPIEEIPPELMTLLQDLDDEEASKPKNPGSSD